MNYALAYLSLYYQQTEVESYVFFLFHFDGQRKMPCLAAIIILVAESATGHVYIDLDTLIKSHERLYSASPQMAHFIFFCKCVQMNKPILAKSHLSRMSWVRPTIFPYNFIYKKIHTSP